MKKLRVRVVEFGNRNNYQLQWNDLITGRKKTKDSGVARGGAKARKDAERAAGDLEKDLRNGLVLASQDITWLEFRQRYEQEVLPSLADGTARRVDSVFNTLERILPQVRNGPLRELNAEQASALQAELRKLGRSEATIKAHLAHLHAALAWAVDQGHLSAIPKMKRPKRARRSGKTDSMKGRPVTSEEFERMLDAVPVALAMPMFRGRPRPRKDPERKIKPKPKVEYVPSVQEVESWRHILSGLWWSGLRLGEALNLWWIDPSKSRIDASKICVELKGDYSMLHIPGALQKSGKDQQCPIAPEFFELLDATPEADRRGKVFKPISRTRGVVSTVEFVGRVISLIGEVALVKVRTENKKDPKIGELMEVIKYASAHDLRRSFGERWANLVMPQELMVLMRHENIETTMRYYVGRNANRTANTLWEAYRRQKSNNFGNNGLLEKATEQIINNATPCKEPIYKVRPAGLEPATSGLEIRYSIH
jgi:integrase